MLRELQGMRRVCVWWLLAILFSGCGSSSTCLDGDTINDGDADQADQADATDTSDDADGDFEIAPPELPRLTDWKCPPEWRSVPAFVDENGNEDVPEGMHQYTICEPPEYWSGPSGPVRLRSWECPAGWLPVVHEELTDENGLPFSWCEPPKLARLFVPGGNDDGTDYLTPLSEGENQDDYQICDLSQGMMPELWGTRCVPIGDPCPAGDFPEIPAEVTGNRIYVKAGTGGGNGTIGQPWGTIRDAILNSIEGDVILLGPGTYNERVSPTTSRTIWGACSEKVTINGPTGGAVVQAFRHIELRNVRITGSGIGVETMNEASIAILRGVAVDRAQKYGLHVEMGTIEIADVVVFNTRNYRGEFGWGVYVQGGVRGTIERGLLERNRDVGIFVRQVGSATTLTDVAVRETRAVEGGVNAGSRGRGMNIQEGARVSVERGLFKRNRDVGIFAAYEDSEVTLLDVVVQETIAVEGGDQAGQFGRGLGVEAGARATVERGLFKRNRDVGIFATHEGSEATLLDVMALDTMAVEGGNISGQFGRGLGVQGGARVTVERGLFERNRETGIIAFEEGSVLNLTDVIVRETQATEGGPNAGSEGRGMNVVGGARVTVERALFERNRDTGIFAALMGSVASLTDVAVRNTEAEEGGPNNGGGGRGLIVQDGARVTVARAQIERNRELGIFAANEGSVVDLTDVTVMRTRTVAGGPYAGLFGVGLLVQDGARVTVGQGRFEENRSAGIAAFSEGSEVILTDVNVRETQAAEGGLQLGSLGRGLNVQDGARVTVERGLFERNRDIGIAVLTEDSQVTLTDAIVRTTLLPPCALLTEGDLFRCVPAGMHGIAEGTAAFDNARLEARRFAILDNAVLGILIARNGQVLLSDGVVSGHDIGVNIQVEGYDLKTLKNNVVYSNRKNLAFDALPIPDPMAIQSDIIEPETWIPPMETDLRMPLPAKRPLPMRAPPKVRPVRPLRTSQPEKARTSPGEI